MKFLIVIEKTESGFSAYSPDLDGCVATGSTRKRAEGAMKRAIRLHLQGLREQRIRVPRPQSSSAYVEVPVPA